MFKLTPYYMCDELTDKYEINNNRITSVIIDFWREKNSVNNRTEK